MVFQQKSQKTHGVFWFSNRNPKNTGFLGFSPETEQENQKKPCGFLVFHLKSKNSHVIFRISVGKPKNPRKKQKIQEFRAPQKGFGFLDFWFFGFRRRHYKTKNPKIQNLSEGPETFGFFFGFLGFFLVLGKPKIPKVSSPAERFWIFGFLVFWFPPS